MSELVGLEVHDGIAVITVDSPPVNAVSQAVRIGIQNQVRAAFTDTNVKAVVIRAAGRTFMSGSDIREFDAPQKLPYLGDVADEIEAGPKPVVAAIHGTALGGGFEVALGCHYRIADAKAKVGLPEVALGLVPGAGGTQRLTHLVGPPAAVAAIASGRHIAAAEALKMGAIDEIAVGDLTGAAIAVARRLADSKTICRTTDVPIDAAALPADFFAAARADFRERQRGFPAPVAAIDAIEAAVTLPVREGIQKGREISAEMKATPQSRALRHLFFGEREVGRIPGIPRDLPLRPITKVGVIGAGTMGTGIAVNFLSGGFHVTVIDAKPEALERCHAAIAKIYARDVEKGRLKAEVQTERMGRLATGLDVSALADVDLVIEAAFENLAVKREIFRKLDAACKPGAILASNTSTLDLNQIAAATRRPQDAIGTHFFSPAHIMRLLEVVRGEKTAKDVIATLMALAKRIDKIAVLSGVCFGFIGNRMFEGYIRESQRLLLEGCTPAQVDKALTDFGMAMGPCAVIDLAGVDISFMTREGNRANQPPDPTYCLIGDKLNHMGRLGRKTGKGFYLYGPKGAESDPEIETLARGEAARLKIPQRAIADDEIVARCVTPLITDGAQILSEGIALRPVDCDVVWCAGYGFPRYRGGPMFYADSIGLKTVVDGMARFAKDLGNDYGYWTPAPLLRELAEAGKSFKDVPKP